MKPKHFGLVFFLTFSLVYAVDKLRFLEDFLGKLPGKTLEARLCWKRGMKKLFELTAEND